jgi:hypothetical protein
VRVSRIAVKDGATILGREVPPFHVSELMAALGINSPVQFEVNYLAELVWQTGKPVPIKGPEALHLKRSLVNGTHRLELTGWSVERLDWYKAQGCFTEIIRYQTRLFVPRSEMVAILEAMSKS